MPVGVGQQSPSATGLQKAVEERDSLQGTKEWARVRNCRVSVDYRCSQIVKILC